MSLDITVTLTAEDIVTAVKQYVEANTASPAIGDVAYANVEFKIVERNDPFARSPASPVLMGATVHFQPPKSEG